MTSAHAGATVRWLAWIAVVVNLLALFQTTRIGIAQASSNPQPEAPPAQSEQRLSHPMDDQVFASVYRDFYNTYRLGPADLIAIHLERQPDYSMESAKISPVGRIYHPLLGEV